MVKNTLLSTEIDFYQNALKGIKSNKAVMPMNQ